MHSSKLKQRAISLRKTGASLAEIALILGISKSTASLWLSTVQLTKLAAMRLSTKQLQVRTNAAKTRRVKQQLIEKCEEQEIFQQVKDTPLSIIHMKLLCAFLYWGEGGKTEKYIAFTNSDPAMISVFIQLLRSCFPLDESKFRALVHVHEYHNQKEIISFWSRCTLIPTEQFTKSYLKENTGKVKNATYKGTLRIRYYDAKIAREIKYLYNTAADLLIKGV